MYTEVKQYKVRCDCCLAESETLNSKRIPRGWTQKEVGPCGMTNYFRTENYCFKCSKKKNNR